LHELGDIDLGGIWAIDGSTRLDEEDWNVWDGHVGFFGMVAVVQTHATDDGNIGRR